jgi:hypothetical protein
MRRLTGPKIIRGTSLAQDRSRRRWHFGRRGGQAAVLAIEEDAGVDILHDAGLYPQT